MPVQVSLIDLVSVPGTRPLWPPEFEGFVKAMEGNDRAAWGAAADWLRDHGETDLEEAFRFVFKRDKVSYKQDRGTWVIENLPRALNAHSYYGATDGKTLAGAVAALARVLKIAREELS